MRVKKDDLYDTRIVIDLTGPEGNAFYILGVARQLGEQIYGREKTDKIIDSMKESDYENLVNIFEEHFGQVVTIVE